MLFSTSSEDSDTLVIVREPPINETFLKTIANGPVAAKEISAFRQTQSSRRCWKIMLTTDVGRLSGTTSHASPSVARGHIIATARNKQAISHNSDFICTIVTIKSITKVLKKVSKTSFLSPSPPRNFSQSRLFLGERVSFQQFRD